MTDPEAPAVPGDEPPPTLRQVLRAMDVSEAEIEQARRDGTASLLAIEHLVLTDPPEMDLAELTRRAAVSPEQVADLWRALGFADPMPRREGLHQGRRRDARPRHRPHRQRRRRARPGAPDDPRGRLVDRPHRTRPDRGVRARRRDRRRHQLVGGARQPRLRRAGRRGAAHDAQGDGLRVAAAHAGRRPEPGAARRDRPAGGLPAGGRVRRPRGLHRLEPAGVGPRAGRGGEPLRGARLRHGGAPRWSGREDDRRRGDVQRRRPPAGRRDRAHAGGDLPATTTSCPTCGSAWPTGRCSSARATASGRW